MQGCTRGMLRKLCKPSIRASTTSFCLLRAMAISGCEHEEALRLPSSLEWQGGQTCRLTAQLMACRSHRRDSRSERGTSARRRGKSGAQTNDACKTKLSGPSLDLHSCNTGLLGCRLFVFRGAHAESCRLGRQSSCLMLDDPGRPCEQQSLPAAEAGA